MNFRAVPAPARTDLPASAPSPAQSQTVRPFLAHGALLTAGALSWAATSALFGVAPEQGTTAYTVGLVASGLFQVGLLALLRVLWQTQALGRGRLARTVLVIESALVVLAMAWTVGEALGITDITQFGWALLDACWPLSMLGMFAIGVWVAVAGRWHGISRCWPLVAVTWLPILLPVQGMLGPQVAAVAATLHLVVGYGLLGVIVARKTQP